MAGIYIHIPFCKKKCKYCNFFSSEDSSQEQKYLSALKKEAALFGKKYKKKTTVDTIFIGGGTPSLVNAEYYAELYEVIKDNFELAENLEFTMESNPTSVDLEYLKKLRAIGINRISIGVQSLIDEELKLLGRIHDSKQALKAIDDIIEAGFENINCDVIFSIPNQTPENISYTLEELTKRGVHHISLYSLIYEEGTQITKEVDTGKYKPVNEQNDQQLYKTTYSLLKEKGFNHYEVSNYAKPGYECRHNLTYWEGRDYYGFGTAAHAFLQGVRCWNVEDIAKYIDLLDKDELPIDNMEKLTEENKLSEKLFLGLRARGLDLETIRDGQDNKYLEDFIERLIKEKKAVIENGKLRLTDDGLFLSDEIAVRIFNYQIIDYDKLTREID